MCMSEQYKNLKMCPKCEEYPELMSEITGEIYKPFQFTYKYQVICRCNNYYSTEDEAIKAWNEYD